MSAKTQLVSADRVVPAVYAGKLEPNYFCRGWNGKRNKYCRSRAGFRTSHPGVGRCSKHGGLKRAGDDRVTSGRTSAVKSSTLAALIEQESKRADPLNLNEELAILRALRKRFMANAGEDPDRTVAQSLLDAAGRMVERIERIRSQNAISRPELGRIMQEIWRSIDARVPDEDVKVAIRDDLLRIAL